MATSWPPVVPTPPTGRSPAHSGRLQPPNQHRIAPFRSSAGITGGYHRLLSHRSYQTSRPVQARRFTYGLHVAVIDLRHARRLSGDALSPCRSSL